MKDRLYLTRVLLYSLVIAILLTGCAGVAPTEEATAPEIVIWIKEGPRADALNAAAKAYTDETGNPVTILVLGSAGYRDKYLTALAAGATDFDGVHEISRVIPSLAAGGLIAPLDEAMFSAADYDASDIPDSVWREARFDGKTYLAPTDLNMEALFLRTDLIPSPPATWEDLRQTALEFTKSHNPNSPTEYGYAYSGLTPTLYGTWSGIMAGYGASLIDENGCVVVDRPEAAASFQMLADMKCVDASVPSDVGSWDSPEITTALQQGVVPMAAGFPGNLNTLNDCDASPLVCGKIALFPQPAGPNGSWTRVFPMGVFINAASTKQEAVNTFLAWLTGPKGARIYHEAGGLNPRTSILQDPEFVAERPWTQSLIEPAKHGVGSVWHPLGIEMNDVFAKWAAEVLACNMTAEDAFAKAAEELRTLTDEASNPLCK
jgi:multiple sugar transport system substrate-binding protein